MRAGGLLVLISLVLAIAPAAVGDDAPPPSWLPHATDATWEYQWTDSTYNTTPTKEKVTVCKAGSAAPCTAGDPTPTSFQLTWTTDGENNPAAAPLSHGTVSFAEQGLGLATTDWNSNLPPANFPALCATAPCGNSLASAYYNIIWGSRFPTLFEPLLQGTTWSTTGGDTRDVPSSSTNAYVGTEMITVPAFPNPVLASKIRSQVTQAGAPGDPYGSGIRTTWWVYGVGPVKVEFDHSGGTNAPVTTAVLVSTNQTPAAPPSDANFFPLKVGLTGTFRWTNPKLFPKKPVVESFSVDQQSNGTGQISVKNVSGPIAVNGSYGFTTRLDGVTNFFASTSSKTLVKMPPLGPRSLPPDQRRHFRTPFDLMTFGFNPVIPAYPAAGNAWTGAASGRDYQIYGVTGNAVVLGLQKIKVPAGTFNALAVRTTLKQPGFPFGSGVRTSWFAPNRGLVKLVFKHGDGSVSTVELLK